MSSLQILISHTGQCLQANPTNYGSFEAFRSWVATKAGLIAQNVVFLSAQGRIVKKLVALNETVDHIFAYDGNIFKNSGKTTKFSVSSVPVPENPNTLQPPNAIKNETDIQSWQELFEARRTWAQQLVGDCARLQRIAELRYRELDVFRGSIAAALENAKSCAVTIEFDIAGAQAWHTDLTRDYRDVLDDIEHQLTRLRSCRIPSATVHFVKGQDASTRGQTTTLQDFVSVPDVRRSAVAGKHALSTVQQDLLEIERVWKQLRQTLDTISVRGEQVDIGEGLHGASGSVTLLEDIEAVAKKISDDCQNVLGLSNNPTGVSQASKAALLHTRKHLPNLVERGNEMYEMLIHATELRKSVAIDHTESIRAITTCNALCAELTARLDKIAISKEHHQALDLLQFVDHLPVTYASFLAEAIRRHEWNEKIKADSSTLANEMAMFQEEEEQRRRKWAKAPDALFWSEKTEYKVLGLEVNLLGEENKWPLALRQDFHDYLETIKFQKFRANILTEITSILSDLDVPTKRQVKRSNTFRNGSVHDITSSGLGQSVLLVRGDPDTIRGLQEDKAKLESKFKGAESRIRKLEGLLHRQVAQVTTTGSFQPNSASPELQEVVNPFRPASPRLHNDSRRSSIDSRRPSVNYGQIDRAMAQKITELEANLISEKERCASFERELAARADSTANIKHHVKEIDATKQDLLQNLEAQRKEFDIERKSLLSEIKEYKLKIENYEDDVDRLLGSRETEKAGIDEQVRDLQQEFDRERARLILDVQKAQGQVDYLRNNAKLQSESNETLTERLQASREEVQNLRRQAEKSEEYSTQCSETLQALHKMLCSGHGSIHTGDTIYEQIIQRVETIVSDNGNHSAKLQMAHSQRDQAQATIVELKSELLDSNEKLDIADTNARHLKDDITAHMAKCESLETELIDEREQLSKLRIQLSAGETGSGTLRIRLEEEELKATTLSKELASATSRVGSLEEELVNVQEKIKALTAKYNVLSERFEGRTGHTKDLTQRLYAQNDRLRRLLERLSYSITRDGDSMIIQRIPKVERTNANDSSDPGTVARRSISRNVTNTVTESNDLEPLYWMHNSDCETESGRYNTYLSTMGNFDVEAFCETILKRVKDLEHTLRKHTKDSRLYRERHQRAQKEASEKIAYKNFKDGDLALFLPTRNQATGAWAAFNVGAPHYFLHEQDSHKLRTRDWLLARIHKIEERVVDLAKSMTANAGDRGSIGETSIGGESYEDDNPFDLSDGLRWYLIDATEEKSGAPSTPGLGKSTAAVTSVDATGVIRRTKKTHISGVDDVSKKLTRSLDSRRDSGTSKRVATSINSADPSSFIDVNVASEQLQVPTECFENGESVQSVEVVPISNTFQQVRESPSVEIDSLMGP